MTPTRRVVLGLTYNSSDISASVTGMVESFDYCCKTNSKETDELTVVLEDKDGLWSGKWFPERGAKVTASLTCQDWPGGATLECGSFEIDDCTSVGPPSTFTIGALAVGISNSLRREKNTREWESITFSAIAGDIASNHGFELFYDAHVDPRIDRYDQIEETDIEMLGSICGDNGFGIKIADGKIIIFEECLYDAKDPEITFTKEADGYVRHSLRASSAEIYTSCEVKYYDPVQRLLISYTHTPGASEWSHERPPTGYVLRLKQRCSCVAEAERLARAALRDQNDQEVAGTITMLGNPAVRSGLVASLSNFGKFDNGRYMIERAQHSYNKSDGYTTTASIRGVLDY